MTKHLGSLALGAMSVALTLTLALGGHVASVSASSARSGDLHIEKNCSAYTGAPGGYCTITVSNLPEIPANTTRVFYDQAYGLPAPDGSSAPGMLDSNVVLYAGFGDWAVGRCTLNVDGSTGLCTFSDGVGQLAGFHARVAVSSAGGANYFWNGTYHFDPGN
jgi:hypothetical protein